MLEAGLSRMLYPMPLTLCGMTLAERVSEAIEAAKRNGHSVSMIAAACGITPQAVYQWANGSSTEIDGSNLAELAELSGYRPLWIMKEKGNRTDGKQIQAAVKLMRQLPTEDQVAAVRMIGGLRQPGVEVEAEDASPKKATASLTRRPSR